MNPKISMYKIVLFILFTLASSALFSVSKAQGGWKHFTGDNTDETAFNKISKSAQRASRDLENLPASFSLKKYTPVPGDQGKQGTCVAWSAGYAARTISYCIQHGLTEADKIKAVAFSPAYLYYFVKTPGDNTCVFGANIETAMKVLTDTGDVLVSSNVPGCMNTVDNGSVVNARTYTIKAYSSLTNTFGRITKNEVIAIKKSIAENKPVIFSIKYFKSFDSVGSDGIWKKSSSDENSVNHALCIIGYDDNKLGGAFEVMNSWGTSWGNGGFFWLTYDQMMQYGSYALEMMDKEVYDPNGSRGFGTPKLTGSLDFVLSNDFGNDGSTMPVEISKIDGFGLPAGDNGNAVFSDYRLTENYAGGTKFKIKFTTNAPAFVYIFSIDDHKTVSTLFPYADNISPAVNSTDATIYLPSEEKHYTLNADADRDRIFVLYSKAAIDFDNLRKRISKTSSTVYETIVGLFNNRLMPLKNINFKEDKVSFSANAGEQELVCFFIDMDHK